MRAISTLLLLLAAAPASAATYEIRPGDDLYAQLRSLAPGDELVVYDGTYTTGGFLEIEIVGTASAPIVVRAADGQQPIMEGVSWENVINLSGSYFTLRGFDIRGGSHGLRLGSVAHVTLEDLAIHAIGNVGISCNISGNVCDNLVVRRNEIYDTGGSGTGPGEGMYIGCNDAACVVSNSIFEQNYIHDIGGTQGDGIEIKTGSFGNVVSDNVIIGANYPAITMYGFAAGERNVVERNFIWGTNDNGIQIVGQVIVRNNIILDAGGNGIHAKPSQGFEPRDLEIVHNTVWNAGSACMKTNGWGGQTGQVIANNVFYCQGGLAVDINGGAPAATFAGNLTLGEVRIPGGGFAPGTAAADLGDPSGLVFYPPAGSPLIDAGDASYGASDDFNQSARTDGMPDVGAYEATSAMNPGWTLGMDFKPAESTPPPMTDAGVPSSDAGTVPPGTDGGPPPGIDGGPVQDLDGGSTTPVDDAGCGCRAVGRSGAPAIVWLFAALAGWVRRRRANRS